jgi:hypothetical protein
MLFILSPFFLPSHIYSRTKHVSFARSLTLASFDDAIGVRQNRLLNARSQERLIGGKKATMTITQQPPPLQQIPIMQVQAIPILQKTQLQQTLSQPHLGQLSNQQISELHSISEKQKRNVMKTQATQTEMFLGRKQPAAQTLSLSPRTVHRVSHSLHLIARHHRNNSRSSNFLPLAHNGMSYCCFQTNIDRNLIHCVCMCVYDQNKLHS